MVDRSAARRLPWGYVVWWGAYAGIYLLFVSVSVQELVAASLVAAAAVALSRVSLRAAGISFTGALPQLHRLAAVARVFIAETRAVAAALFERVLRRRPLRGRFIAVPVDHRIDAALDAAITLEASVAPNTYVVALIEGQECLLLHQLAPRPDPKRSFPRWAT
ncbi:MAG: hypothetical protein M3N57_02285 [Actinomycetota bacterium]|nr:hypothetical protein [Actinomycetota bacterium]